MRLLRLLMSTALLASLCASADDLSNPIGVRPISATFAIDPGPATYFREASIDPASLYDPRYKLKSISITDITVATIGPDLGRFNGSVKVNGTTLFTYDGNWSEFNTAQSILKSKLVKKSQAGINKLMSALTKGQPVVLSVSGIVGKAPAAKNTNSITVYAPMQGAGVL